MFVEPLQRSFNGQGRVPLTCLNEVYIYGLNLIYQAVEKVFHPARATRRRDYIFVTTLSLLEKLVFHYVEDVINWVFPCCA